LSALRAPAGRMPALHLNERNQSPAEARTEQIIKLMKRAHPDAHCA